MTPLPWTLPLTSNLLTLELAGGKGANLSRLLRAGFNVPEGFVVTTPAYQAFVAQAGLAEDIQQALKGLDPRDPNALEAASARIRVLFENNPLPDEIRDSIRAAYQALGASPVAVRSSATAEDLPELSFAGQQDTYLNIRGEAAVIQAVRRCWASLWTARAIGYRARNHIPQDQLALAVVVQALIESEVSGVMFTANPLTGRRDEVVIDAIFGLGEALVSGQAEPDNLVVRKGSAQGGAQAHTPAIAPGTIMQRSTGSKAVVLRSASAGGVTADADLTKSEEASVDGSNGGRTALTDAQALALAELGQRVEAEYGSPQDIEWALARNRLYLLQSRAVTSLYPPLEGVPPAPLQLFISFASVQGVLDPISPLGRDIIASALIIGGGRALFRRRMTLANQGGLRVAGERLFINLTPIARNSLGRRAVSQAIVAVEPGAQADLLRLLDEPDLAPGRRAFAPGTLLGLLPVLLITPFRVLHTLLRPDFRREQLIRDTEVLMQDLTARSRSARSLGDQLALIDYVMKVLPPFLVNRMLPVFAPGVFMLLGLNHLAKGMPEGDRLVLEITRGMPHNVTTDMDLDLWESACALKADPSSAQAFASRSAAELAADFRAGRLPDRAQAIVGRFLERYGARGVGEIDLGRPRWQEDPTPVMQALLSYLRIEDKSAAPDATFARSAEQAEAAAEQLARAAAEKTSGLAGRIKARQARWAARRVRALAGLREFPKFTIVRIFGLIRPGLLASGQALVRSGVLQQPEDIVYLRLPELQTIASLQNADGSWSPSSQLAQLAGLAAERKARAERERLRRQVPRLLLSDGRAFYGSDFIEESASADANTINGSPVSPGVSEGRVRIVLSPHGAQLEPGEILVCPGTDPAWTPLFLAAGGLVMEVGGLMTHGSVVAREYGIPAVVGVRSATQRLRTGQHIRVDGSKGIITLLDR